MRDDLPTRDAGGEAGTVLVLDDEEMVATAIESFLQLETDFRVLTFTSPAEALEAAEEERIQVAVVDYLMPGMDGIAFLERLREVRPAATRVLLTGYADKENAIRAINEAGIYYYLEKPWENERLKLVLRNGAERSRLFRELEDRVSALEEANEELQEFRQRLIRAFL